MIETFIDTTVKQISIDYPCMRVHRDGGLVVLFSGPRKGTVVSCSNYSYKVGDHYDSWNMDMFCEPTPMSLTLSNVITGVKHD